MRKLNILLGVSLLTVSNFLNAQNPFESIGKTTKPMLSLSDGRYIEYFNNDSVRQIGSAMVNVYTEQIVAFVDRKEQAKKVHSQTSSRFLSIDPLARSFPELTPYQYASNTPIQAIDLDGLEKFKISDKSVDYYDPATGQTTTTVIKSLTLQDVHAKFEVVDEHDVSMNNFKYCTFQCQMEGFRVENQTPGGDNSSRLVTPNSNQSTKINTENTFEMTTLDTKPVKFTPVKLGGNFSDPTSETDFGDALLNTGAYVKAPEDKYNAYEAGQKASIIRIANGTSLSNEDILNNLKSYGLVNDKASIEFSKGEKGKVDIQFGNYSCPNCGAKGGSTGGSGGGGTGGGTGGDE